jgi:aspartate aminotransferase
MIATSVLANSVQPSATLAAGAKARQLRAAGVQVFDFSLGEPDFPTPAHICAAAQHAMQTGQTHYTPVGGTLEARQALVKWYQRSHGLVCKPDEILISNGAKHSIHNALAAVCNPGDEVIIPTPYWVSYSDLVRMTGATPHLVTTSFASGFKLTPAQLRAALTPRSKLIMLNSPCNPTGTTYTRAELQALVEVMMTTNLVILSDEIYEQLTFDDAKPTCVATLHPDLPARTITVSGLSKTYAMTGWRMGWSVAPKNVTDAMNNIQSQETGCPSSIGQAALIAALEGPQDCVAEMRREFAARRNLTCELVRAIPGLKIFVPDGAFYLFFDVSAYFGRELPGGTVTDAVSFCKVALEHAHVNLVPGDAFGAPGYARLSYATSPAVIRGGLAALAAWLGAAK